MRVTILLLFVIVALGTILPGQQSVAIRVDASVHQGPFRHVWPYFGYDEPNLTYSPHGQKLLQELSELSPTPVHIRMHNLLTSGDGTPALKWGSTNVYTEDAAGHAVNDWTILDRIFDTLIQFKIKPLVEIGFMPEALSAHPQPYKHDWPNGTLWTGWAHPPKDYRKWADLVYSWARHAVARYGQDEVLSWHWEVWNEPDIGYWQGSREEYFKLYDFATDAVKRALPRARVGGPDSTGPADPLAAEFLRQFLEHCAQGTNYATRMTGAPLDFVAFHAKGDPKMIRGHVRMGISRHIESIARGFQTVSSFPKFKHLPIILGESDPEGCAACSAHVHPQNAYRNGTLYPCYTAEVFSRILELAAIYSANVAGMVTWAFEFEGQPYFAGFRTLATNGIDKPALNVFRMFGLMGSQQVLATSSSSIPLASVLRCGVIGPPDVNTIAARDDRGLSVLVWNYHDDALPAPDASVQLSIGGLSPDAARVLVAHYRIDATHSNAYSIWKEMGSPQRPTSEQQARMSSGGRLQELGPAEWIGLEQGTLRLNFRVPRHAVSLIQVTW